MIQRIKELAYDTVAQKFIARNPAGKKIEVPLDSAPSGGVDMEWHRSTGTVESDVITWNVDVGDTLIIGRTLLDLTDPTKPLAVVAGLYAVQIEARPPLSAGHSYNIELDLDVDGNFVPSGATPSTSLGAAHRRSFVTVTGYLPAGGGIQAYFDTDAGAPINPDARLTVSLVKEGTPSA